jgi:hypothetical protein
MPYWKFSEETSLKEMLEEDKSLEEICKVLHRTREAVVLKVTRLGLEIPEKCLAIPKTQKDVKPQATTTTQLPAIKPRELISMKEMMETMLGALNQLQNPQCLSSLELKRCRAIVSLARVYMSMLEKFTEWTHFEQEMVNLNGQNLIIFKQLLQEAKDPAQRAKFERNIKDLEKTLEEDKKLYGYTPFTKKPDLVVVDMP